MLPEVVVEIIPSRSLEGTGVVDQDVDVSQLIGDPVAGGFDRRPVADVEPHRNRLVARVGDEADGLTGIAAVPENDPCAAPGQTHGYGLADAPGGSGHQRYPSGVGFRGVVRWHVACPFCEGGPMGGYEATAGFRTCSHHWRKLVGVEFSGVRWTALSMPSFLAQAMSVIPWAMASDMPKLTNLSL
jgi:hypothetical protein